MVSSNRKYLYIFTTISSSAFFGASLFIGLSIGSLWLKVEPVEFMNQFWTQFESFTLTIMPLFTLTLVGFVACTKMDWQISAAKKYWLIALAFYIATFLLTLFYFRPVNFAFKAAAYSGDEISHARKMWLSVNVLRLFFICIPYFSLKAIFASFEDSKETSHV